MKTEIKVKIKKWSIYFIGLFFLSLGISLTVKAQIWGVGSWDVFHIGLLNYLPLNLGTITQIVSLVAIIIGMFLGVRPKIGTIINALLVGWLLDIILNFSFMHTYSELSLISFLTFLLGILLLGLGTGLYIAADVGTGPRDSIMVGLNKKFGIRIAAARTGIEIFVVGIGFLFSGPLGLGTVILALSVGFIVERTLAIIKRLGLVSFREEVKDIQS